MPVPAYDPAIAAFLEEIRSGCNAAVRLRRDPLAIVVSYPEGPDRELAGLVASTLAFGSVDLIMRACKEALAPLGSHPRAALLAMGDAEISRTWSGFQYRYCFPRDMIALMRAARRAIDEEGSLEAFFSRGDAGGPDIVAATGSFARRLLVLARDGGGDGGLRPNLLPDTARGSACKRLFLYLRWMARHDEVDLGCWTGVDPSRLVVPMDTHMARVASGRLHFIPVPRADLKAALAVTAAFRLYSPQDPVRYDFALTRPGIDPDPGDERYGCD